MVIVLAVLAALAATILTERGDRPEASLPVPTRVQTMAENTAALPAKHQEALAKIDSGDVPGRAVIELRPPFLLSDGRTLDDGKNHVRLSGLQGPDGDAVCLNSGGAPWACGLQARAALNNLTRGRTVTCEVATGAGGPAPGHCRTEEGDLAVRLFRLGFARPVDGAEMADAVEQARKEKRGLWEGSWTIRPTTSKPAGP